MPKRLENKVSIITGGVSGIGEATASLFAKEGAKVVIADLDEQMGEKLARQLKANGGEALFIKTDVTDERQVSILVQQTMEIYGKLDVLFANAGIAHSGAAHEVTLDDWNLMIGVNLTGVFLCNKYAIQAMLEKGSGSIINCASILGHVGKPHITSYAAAKGGVVNMTRSMAVTYAQKGIRVNAVCPGYIESPLLSGLDESLKESLRRAHPIGRLGTCEEVAKAVLFLASDESSFVVGANLIVDGGYTAQ